MTRFFAGLLTLGLLALLCAAPRPAQAAASYDTCKGFITSLPATIDTAGTWCFNKDLSTAISTGTAILINSSDVTIDCNGYKLGGLAAGEGTSAWGIAEFDRQNITVRHCNIRGFSFGITLSNSSVTVGNHLIEDNRFDGNTNYGIIAAGDGTIVRRNLVNNTGFTTLSGGGTGINASGWIDVIDNTVAGVTATASYVARGIEVDNDNGSVTGNRVSGVLGNSSTQVTGIFASSSHATVRDNNISGSNVGFSYGVYCSNASGVTKDNVINNMGSAITNCSDGGGNDISP
jgi:hypothetical protein